MQIIIRRALLFLIFPSSRAISVFQSSSHSLAFTHTPQNSNFTSLNNRAQLSRPFISNSKTAMNMVTMDSPSAQRNKDPIWQVIQSTILPMLKREDDKSPLRVLEIAGGCGVHTEHFVTELAKKDIGVDWYPTDPDPESLQSLKARVDAFQLPNDVTCGDAIKISIPFSLKLGAGGALEDSGECSKIISGVGSEPLNLIICINMIHISPWDATLGLFKVASEHLKNGGILMTYGPYKVNGSAVESNMNFDASLKSRNAEWGVRDLERVQAVAEDNGLKMVKVQEMPANNLLCIFQK